MRRALVSGFGALVLVLGAAACGGGSEEAEPDTSSDFATEAPETESTEGTEEAEQNGNEAVAVELPGLPIGGSSNVVSETLQCVDVSWSGPPDLPSGWGITVTGIAFDPSGDFAQSGEPCPLDTPPCTASGVQITSDGGCHVAVTWTAANTDGGEMAFTRGVALCPPGQESACAGFRGEVETEGLQTISLEPSPVPEETDQGSGEESPTDGTEESPSEGTESESGSTDGGG